MKSPAMIVLITASLLAYFTLRAIYRLYLHPLSKFPGPKWAAITDYWELYQDYFRKEGGFLFIELDRLHEEYGPILRIAPNELHVKDSHWMEVLYPGPTEHRDRDPLVGRAIGTPQATIGTGPYHVHRQRKAAISPFFSMRAVSSMEPTIRAHVEKMFKNLSLNFGGVIDLRVYFFAWNTDFITGQIFQSPSELFWDPKRAQQWFNTLWDFSANFGLTKHAPWMITAGLTLPTFLFKVLRPSLAPFIAVYKSLYQKASQAYGESVNEKGQLFKENFNEETDIFDMILSSSLPLAEKQPRRMANEVYNLLVAGGLTTSKTASIAVYHILANPDIHKRLKKELVIAMPDPAVLPDVKTLKALRLLSATVKETMRVANIVTTRFPMVANDKDLHYHDWVIPQGTSVSMTYCKAALDPAKFTNPRKFDPDRWLEPAVDTTELEKFVLPFGRGSRTCIGMHLAYAQLYMLLAGIFRRFNLTLFETSREIDIDVQGGGPLGEPSRQTKGIRVCVDSHDEAEDTLDKR